MTGEADDSNLALAFARADRIAPILANSQLFMVIPGSLNAC